MLRLFFLNFVSHHQCPRWRHDKVTQSRKRNTAATLTSPLPNTKESSCSPHRRLRKEPVIMIIAVNCTCSSSYSAADGEGQGKSPSQTAEEHPATAGSPNPAHMSEPDGESFWPLAFQNYYPQARGHAATAVCSGLAGHNSDTKLNRHSKRFPAKSCTFPKVQIYILQY